MLNKPSPNQGVNIRHVMWRRNELNNEINNELQGTNFVTKKRDESINYEKKFL